MTTTMIDRRNGIAEGLAIKIPCRAATTANITLSGEQTVDGIALVADDRVLVLHQTDATQNGIYDVSTGAWTRSLDFDGNRDIVKGTIVRVLEGTNIAYWQLDTADPVIGTSSLSFSNTTNSIGGVSAFVQTILDDADASTVLQTLGIGSLVRRMPHLAKKVFNGAARSGVSPDQSLSLSTNMLNWISIGDSVGDTKVEWIGGRLRRALGPGGGFFGGNTLAGGASSHSDVTDCSYWINGQWFSIPSGGSVTFNNGGVSPRCTILKLYYVKRSGAGTFKVQVDGVDEAGYTNVSASNASTTAGVITITKSVGAHNLKVVGLTGTVEIIHAGFIDGSVAGLAYWSTTAGGLDTSNAVNTPVAIVNAVFNDIAPDVISMEFKDGSGFSTAFTSIMSNLTSNLSVTPDYVMIGTTPESNSTSDAQNVVNNAVMRQWTVNNSGIYFDGYTPFGSYAALTALGWNGDGTHPAIAAHLYLASLMWGQLGLDELQGTFSSRDLQAAYSYIQTRAYLGTSSNAVAYAAPSASGDYTLVATRAIVISDGSSNIATIMINGTSVSSLGTGLGLAGPFATSGAAIYANGTAVLSADLSPGNKSVPRPFQASQFDYRIASSTVASDLVGSGTPEGAVTAPVGSTFRRTDGGAATSFYVKETGSGNTGWVGK